jgi:hypothetical protein
MSVDNNPKNPSVLDPSSKNYIEVERNNKPCQWHQNTKISKIVGVIFVSLGIALAAAAIGATLGIAAIPIVAIIVVAGVLGTLSLTSIIGGSVLLGKKKSFECPKNRKDLATQAIQDIESHNLGYSSVKKKYGTLVNHQIIQNDDLNKIYREEAATTSYDTFVAKHGPEVLNVLDDANKASMRASALEALKNTNYKEWKQSVGKPDYEPTIAVLGITNEHINETLKGEIATTTYLDFIKKHGSEVLQVLDGVNKRTLTQNMHQQISQMKYKAWKELASSPELVSFNMTNEDLNACYQNEASKGNYQAFIDKYGIEVLNILDEKNKASLRASYLKVTGFQVSEEGVNTLMGISNSHWNEHIREECHNGEFNSFMLTFGKKGLDILDQASKDLLRKSFIEVLKSSRYESNLDAIKSFGISQEELNEFYRTFALEGKYSEFIQRFGEEVLEILDSQNIDALRMSFLISTPANDPANKYFGLEIDNANTFISKYGLAAYDRILNASQKEFVKKAFIQELKEADLSIQGAKETYKEALRTFQISEQQLKEILAKEETIVNINVTDDVEENPSVLISEEAEPANEGWGFLNFLWG